MIRRFSILGDSFPKVSGRHCCIDDKEVKVNHTSSGLWYIVLTELLMLISAAGTYLMGTSNLGWIILISWTLLAWMCWLYWRGIKDDQAISGNFLLLFLLGPIIIILSHILSAGTPGRPGEGMRLLADSDSGMLIRIITLSLLIILFQDVLSRLGNLRWLLTIIGLIIASGAILELHRCPSSMVQTTVLTGLTGAAMFLTPIYLPQSLTNRRFDKMGIDPAQIEAILRIIPATFLTSLIIFSRPGAIPAAILASAGVAATLLLAGIFLKHHRTVLILTGAILLIGAVVGAYRLGYGRSVPFSVGLSSASGDLNLWGNGGVNSALPPAGMSGAGALVLSTGLVGLSTLIVGFIVAIFWSLYASRNAAPGDQLRCALWSVVSVISALSLMVSGGMALPIATVLLALTWGLMPHVMAYRVGRYKGWPVMLVLAMMLMVLGLESRLSQTSWIAPLLKNSSDRMMHFTAALLLTALLFWQGRCKSWSRALFWTVIGAAIASLGEPIQEYLSARSAQWSDIAWDIMGAGTAWLIFSLIYFTRRIEMLIVQRSHAFIYEHRAVLPHQFQGLAER